MSLLKKMESIPKLEGQLRITANLKQVGSGACIVNADLNGEQKTTINYKDEEVPKISTECLTNGVFKHRIKNIPVNVYESVESDLIKLKELFDILKFNRVEYRGGAVMSKKSPISSEKSLRVDEAVPYDNNKSFFTVENRRLGIKGDSGENDYPRQQILYKNLSFFFSSYLDLTIFHPLSNPIIFKFLEKVDNLDEKEKGVVEFKKEVEQWIESIYVIKDGQLDVEQITNNIIQEIKTYEHPVHKRYNSFLIMNNIIAEKLESREDYEKSLKATQHHHGL